MTGSDGVTALKGVLYYAAGSASTVTAIKESSKTELWSTTTACEALGAPGGSGGTQISVANGVAYVGCVGGLGVYAYSTSTGEEVWGNANVGINGERDYAPSVAGSVVYLLSGGSYSDPFALTAVSASTGDQLWTTGNTLPNESEILSGPVVVSGDVIFTDGGGNVEVYHL